jgi:hypothetical protein
MIQPTQNYRAVVRLLKQDGTTLDTYTTEARHWENVALDVMSWLRIEVLPYWQPGELVLVWDDAIDMRLSGALYGVAISHWLRPTWWDAPPSPENWNPYPAAH